ncbi:hypothetical protein Afil01_20180 [Actinorhabdospora filicis]|uniref:Uncharacterized protein n=1 Tax=Actinorhabdospora filicis TaxID=1785913 RepID=A0A9W6W974_9ACTN|nr:hypothetical protein [Actinorhabdospora filicis]GLZ77211.1 hypothetical protein Afil01_20180 [Actinorhabdospora filicis]
MKTIGKLGDLLVARLIPRATAAAGPCEPVCNYHCEGIRLVKCCRDRCSGQDLGCDTVSRC